jgi:hypothetical protein
MRTLLIILSFLTFTNCSTSPQKVGVLSGEFENEYKKLNLNHSFAFSDGLDKYYFSQLLIEEDKYKCQFYVGFKNGSYTYSFPAYKLYELENVYYEKLTIEKKKKLALQKINSFQLENQKCNKEIAEKEAGITEKIAATAILLFIAPAAVPLTLIFGSDVYIANIKESILNGKMNKIRLGMNITEIKSLLDTSPNKIALPHYIYFTVDNGPYRLAMFFKENRLNAMVRGYNKTFEHKK